MTRKFKIFFRLFRVFRGQLPFGQEALTSAATVPNNLSEHLKLLAARPSSR